MNSSTAMDDYDDYIETVARAMPGTFKYLVEEYEKKNGVLPE